jgi:hypothetical protein
MEGAFVIMKIQKEVSLKEFEFWSGAADRRKYLTDEEMDTIENILDDLYPDGMNETALNDLFWFEEDTIAEWLGYSSFDEIMERDEDGDEEEECTPHTSSTRARGSPAEPGTEPGHVDYSMPHSI